MRYRYSVLSISRTLLLAAALTPCSAQDRGRVLSRTDLVENVQYLASVLEDVHPSPFLSGGGKLAFFWQVDDVIRAIPDSGLSLWSFYGRILPIVAGVGDVHTSLRGPDDLTANGFAIPLDFMALDGALYVKEAYHEEYDDLLGARLDSVGGYAFSDLLERQKHIAGNENSYSGLENLPRFLRWRNGFRLLAPQPAATGGTRATFILSGGERRAVQVSFPDSIRWDEAASLPSRVDLPDTQGEPAYTFLDESKRAALLSIDDMTSYREAFEWFRHFEYDVDSYARELYTQYHDDAPPADYDRVLDGLPSASEIFASLTDEMEAAGTEVLLINLRYNSGGQQRLLHCSEVFRPILRIVSDGRA